MKTCRLSHSLSNDSAGGVFLSGPYGDVEVRFHEVLRSSYSVGAAWKGWNEAHRQAATETTYSNASRTTIGVRQFTC